MRSHKPLINRYDQLTPEERFRLLLLAEARGDTTEADYLEAAASNRQWVAREHIPWRRAFDEMVVFTFIDLIEAAHQWHGS